MLMCDQREVRPVQRTNVYLEDEQLRALKYLAAEHRQSVADLVRQAVDDYLAKHFCNSEEWSERFESLVSRIQKRIPVGATPEQIEADITTARDEVRQARLANRVGAADARGH